MFCILNEILLSFDILLLLKQIGLRIEIWFFKVHHMTQLVGRAFSSFSVKHFMQYFNVIKLISENVFSRIIY